MHSEFNESWAERIKAKEAVEVELQIVVKEKALLDMSKWIAQRDVRLKAKKVIVISLPSSQMLIRIG